MGFNKDYWDANYSEPDTMDGIGNAYDHSSYVKSLFALDSVELRSIVDFGFGLGHLFEEMVRSFRPYKALGLEPSKFAYDDFKGRCKTPENTKLKLECTDIKSWLAKNKTKLNESKGSYDLGICTSVLQYLTDEELEYCIPLMAKSVKYLYLTVPTNKEFKKQQEDLEFFDNYAISRSRTKYLKYLAPHFTFISSRVLESKVYFDHENTPFMEYLYRF